MNASILLQRPAGCILYSISLKSPTNPTTKLTARPTRPTRASPPSVQCSASRPLGVHALVFSGEWTESAAREAISGAQRTGYSFIEIPLLEPATVDSKMTKNLLDEYGITATASLGLNLNADISSPDSNVARRGEELLMQALNAASGFGSEYMCGVIYSAIAKYPTPPTIEGRKNCVAALKRVSQAAADKGVTLGLEVVNRYESNVLNTALQVQTLALISPSDFAVISILHFCMMLAWCLC